MFVVVVPGITVGLLDFEKSTFSSPSVQCPTAKYPMADYCNPSQPRAYP